MNENDAAKKINVGIELSNTEIRAVRLNDDSSVADSLESSFDMSQDTAPQLIDFIKETETKFGYFENLGIAIPGLIDRKTKRIAYSTQIPEHEKVDLLSELEKIVKAKIYIENDANAAAYGEFRVGAGRGSRNMFYVTLGSGVGGALIINGELWRGDSGYAGEFGYLTVNSEGMRLEDLASSENIIRRTKIRFHQDHTSSLNRIGEEAIKIDDVLREANNGDDFAQLMLERTGNYVGMAVAGVINLLDVEKIVIGGKIMRAGNYVLNAIKRRAAELSFQPSYKSTDIVQGKLGENAAAVGAALLAEEIIP